MTPQAAIPLPETFDDSGFEELKAEIAAYVANEGEEWTRRIEAERAVPPELRVELKERGYLLARRAERVRRRAGSPSRATSSCWSSSRCRTRRCG